MSIICNIITDSNNNITDKISGNVTYNGAYSALTTSPTGDNTAFNITKGLIEKNPLLGLTEWSFGGWFKNSSTSEGYLFHFCNGSGYSLLTISVLANKISFTDEMGGSISSISGTYTDWTHIEVGFNGVVDKQYGKQVMLFINGVLATTTHVLPTSFTEEQYNQFWFGQWSLNNRIFGGYCYNPYITNKCLHTSNFTPTYTVGAYNTLVLKDKEVWGMKE